MSLHARPFRLRAPGKLMLLGEYAVLDGAPALVAAVDRCAEVAWRPAAGGGLELRSAMLAGGRLRIAQDAAGRPTLPPWPDSGAALLGAVLETFVAHGLPLPAGELEVASGELAMEVGGAKLGLGSSAAVAVACVAALAPEGARPKDDAERVTALALEAHSRFQGGRGSGADVRAALLGGICLVGSEGSRRIADALPLEVVATGRAADTRVLIDAFRAWQARGPEVAREAVGRLAAIALRGVGAAQAGDVAELAACFGAYAAEEAGITAAGGPAIVSTELARIGAVAASCGWMAKPSGAGGGDCAVALPGPNALPAEGLRNAMKEAGFAPVALGIAGRGALDARAALRDGRGICA